MIRCSKSRLGTLPALHVPGVGFEWGIMTTKVTRKHSSLFDGLAADIVKASNPSHGLLVSRGASEEIRFLEQQDYGLPLRKMFAPSQVRDIVKEATKAVWPQLNHKSVKLVSPSEFTRLWTGLGVQFRLTKLSGPQGLALLGFYVRKMGGSRLPLICVNTAHHPAAVGAAFSHEMGHHLTARLFDSHKEHAQLLAYTAYGEHLSDPEELAADVLVSLGVFPGDTARKIFMEPKTKKSAKTAAEELPDSVFTTVLKYVKGSYGLSFDGALSYDRKLQYMAALIHFAKLRRALLAEYDI